MATISKTGIVDGQIVYAENVTRIIDALDGTTADSIIIDGDFAQGASNTTDGSTSFAHGDGVDASGLYSHAEGDTTQATGNYTHAEGYGTSAQGIYSHAEGDSTISSGDYSHAEGTNTNASGDYAHAEGDHTQAVGNASHASGYYTIAYSNYQTAVGRYNKDLNSSDYFVVGVGSGIGSEVDGLGVNATRTYISNSLFLPNLTSTAQTRVATLDSAGKLYYAASESIIVTNAYTASFVTASNVYGPYGANSILSASYAVTSSYSISSSYALSSSHAVSASWAPSTTPSSPNRSIQFNNSNVFGGSADFVFDSNGNLILNSSSWGNTTDGANAFIAGVGTIGTAGGYSGTGQVVVGYYNKPGNNNDTFIVGGGLGVGSEADAFGVGYDGTEFKTYISTSLYLPSLVGGSGVYVALINQSTGLVTTIATSSLKGDSFPYTGSAIITGSLSVIGPSNITGSLSVSGSGSSVVSIKGSTGPLLTVNDSNSGSLFTVNDISGLPILEVKSTGATLIGTSTSPSLHITKKVVSTAAQAFALGGTLIPTSSYDGAFFEYMAKSGSNARSGYITATWSGSTIVSSSTVSTDIGSTTGLTTFAAISGSYIVLSGSANAADWTVKSIIRAI